MSKRDRRNRSNRDRRSNGDPPKPKPGYAGPLEQVDECC